MGNVIEGKFEIGKHLINTGKVTMDEANLLGKMTKIKKFATEEKLKIPAFNSYLRSVSEVVNQGKNVIKREVEPVDHVSYSKGVRKDLKLVIKELEVLHKEYSKDLESVESELGEVQREREVKVITAASRGHNLKAHELKNVKDLKADIKSYEEFLTKLESLGKMAGFVAGHLLQAVAEENVKGKSILDLQKEIADLRKLIK